MSISHEPANCLSETQGPTHPLPALNLWDLLTSKSDERLHSTALVALHHPSTHLSYLFPRAHRPTESTLSPEKLTDAQSQDHFTCTYAQLQAAAKRVAYVLFSKGVRKGDRVVVMTWNCAEWVVIYWASAWLGTILSPLDPATLGRPDDLVYHLDLLKPTVLFAGDEIDARAAMSSLESSKSLDAVPIKSYLRPTKDCGRVGGKIEGFQSFESLVTASSRELSADARSQFLDRDMPTTNDMTSITFTSGTTNRPKGCAWTAAAKVFFTQTFAHYASIDSTSKLVATTTCFRGIFLVFCTSIWRAGGAVILPSDKFDSKTTLAATAQERGTHMACVPQMIHALGADPDLETYDRQSLKVVLVGGDIVFSGIIKKAKMVLCASWVAPLYGQTEGVGYAHWAIGDDVPATPSGVMAVGRVTPLSAIRICEPGTRQVVPVGDYGELHLNNPATISGYYRTSQDEDKFYHDNGRVWFSTGDQAMIDESGALFVTGRYKDTIKVSAVGFSPAVIEGSLQKIEGITAQVVGIPDQIRGSVPAAVIDSKIHSVTEDMKQRLRSTVARDVGPDAHFHDIFTLEELGMNDYPLNDSGKVVKRELVSLLIRLGKAKPVNGV